jgi:hypothetical protein
MLINLINLRSLLSSSSPTVGIRSSSTLPNPSLPTPTILFLLRPSQLNQKPNSPPHSPVQSPNNLVGHPQSLTCAESLSHLHLSTSSCLNASAKANANPLPPPLFVLSSPQTILSLPPPPTPRDEDASARRRRQPTEGSFLTSVRGS